MQIDSVSIKDLYQAHLDFSLQRARLACENLASTEAAGYQAQRLERAEFYQQLQAVLNSEEPAQSLSELNVSPTTLEGPIRADEQIAELVAASTEFQALLETLNRHTGLMKLAMSSRGGV